MFGEQNTMLRLSIVVLHNPHTWTPLLQFSYYAICRSLLFSLNLLIFVNFKLLCTCGFIYFD